MLSVDNFAEISIYVDNHTYFELKYLNKAICAKLSENYWALLRLESTFASHVKTALTRKYGDDSKVIFNIPRFLEYMRYSDINNTINVIYADHNYEAIYATLLKISTSYGNIVLQYILCLAMSIKYMNKESFKITVRAYRMIYDRAQHINCSLYPMTIFYRTIGIRSGKIRANKIKGMIRRPFMANYQEYSNVDTSDTLRTLLTINDSNVDIYFMYIMDALFYNRVDRITHMKTIRDKYKNIHKDSPVMTDTVLEWLNNH